MSYVRIKRPVVQKERVSRKRNEVYRLSRLFEQMKMSAVLYLQPAVRKKSLEDHYLVPDNDVDEGTVLVVHSFSNTFHLFLHLEHGVFVAV